MKSKTTADMMNPGLIDERFLKDIPLRRKKPDWVTRESLISVGAWEPLFHRRRLGTSWVDDEAFYEYEHSEQLCGRFSPPAETC